MTWAPLVSPVDPTLPNLHRVTPLLYRAAQPLTGCAPGLHLLGVKTLINLRQTVDDAALLPPDIAQVRIPMKSRNLAEDDYAVIVAALRAIKSGLQSGAVLVHCHHGADRTGGIIALYRVLFQNWSKADALDEMQNGGFNFHAVWQNIPRAVANADTDDLRRRVGLV